MQGKRVGSRECLLLSLAVPSGNGFFSCFLFLLFFIFSFSYKDSHQKSTCRRPGRRLQGPPFLILVQGLPSKVEMTVFTLAHCVITNSYFRTRITIKSRVDSNHSCTLCHHKFLFSYKDYHQKSS